MRVLFLILLVAASGWRILLFDYPLIKGHGEASKDYLIAHLLRETATLPREGPNNGILPNTNSPLYYYVLAGALAIYDDFLFLQALNITLQILAIVFLYKLGRIIFGTESAFVAAVIFSFNPQTVMYASHMWQPYLMVPVVLGGYVLLSAAWRDASPRKAAAANGIIATAGAIHNAAFAMLPFTFLIGLYIAYKSRGNWRAYASVVVVPLIALLVFYTPVFMYGNYGTFHKTSQFIGGFSAVKEVTTTLTQEFVRAPFNTNTISVGFGIIAIFFIYTVLLPQKRTPNRPITLMMTGATLLFIVIVSYLPHKNIHYFTPVAGLFFLACAEMVKTVFSQTKVLNLLRPFAFLALILFFSSPPMNLHNFPERSYKNFTLIEEASVAIYQDTGMLLPTQKEKPSRAFFQIASYSSTDGTANSMPPELFLVPLQRFFPFPLATLDSGGSSIVQIGANQYIYLMCIYRRTKTPLTETTCTETYLRDHPQYVIEYLVYKKDAIIVYRTKRSLVF